MSLTQDKNPHGIPFCVCRPHLFSDARPMNWRTVAADAATSDLDNVSMHRNTNRNVIQPRQRNQQSVRQTWHKIWNPRRSVSFLTTIEPIVCKSVEWNQNSTPHSGFQSSQWSFPGKKQLVWISGRWFTPWSRRFPQVDDEHEEKVSAEKMKAQAQIDLWFKCLVSFKDWSGRCHEGIRRC